MAETSAATGGARLPPLSLKPFIPNHLPLPIFSNLETWRGRAKNVVREQGVGRPTFFWAKRSGWEGQAIHSLVVCPIFKMHFSRPPTRGPICNFCFLKCGLDYNREWNLLAALVNYRDQITCEFARYRKTPGFYPGLSV